MGVGTRPAAGEHKELYEVNRRVRQHANLGSHTPWPASAAAWRRGRPVRAAGPPPLLSAGGAAAAAAGAAAAVSAHSRPMLLPWLRWRELTAREKRR